MNRVAIAAQRLVLFAAVLLLVLPLATLPPAFPASPTSPAAGLARPDSGGHGLPSSPGSAIAAEAAGPVPPVTSGGGEISGANVPGSSGTVWFNESGLPSGTSWSVSTWSYDAPGAVPTTTSGTAASLAVSVVSSTSTIDFAIWTVPDGQDATLAWYPTPTPLPPIAVSAGSSVSVTFEADHPVDQILGLHVLESGLPASENWTVSVGGSSYGTTGPAQLVRLGGGFQYDLNASPQYGSNGTAYFPVAFDFLPCLVGSGWSNVSFGPQEIDLEGAAYEIVVYQVEYRLSVDPSVGGSATPASLWTPPGTPVALAATEASEYSFVGWTGIGPGSVSSLSLNITVTPSGPVEELATFRFDVYTVLVSEVGIPASEPYTVLYNGLFYSTTNGTVVLPASPGGSYHLGAPYEYLNDSPYVRYVESGLTSSLGVVNGSTLIVNGNGTALLSFSAQYSVTLATVGPGMIVPGPGSYWAPAGANFYVTATANPGAYFDDWTTSGVGIAGPASLAVPVTGPVWETAEFGAAPNVPTYSLAVTETGLPTGAVWSVSAAPYGVTGGSSTLVLVGVPAGTYELNASAPGASIGIRWVTGGANSAVISANSTAAVSFSEEYEVRVVAGPGGSATPSLNWVAPGTVVSLSAAAAPGGSFSGWSAPVSSRNLTVAWTVTAPLNVTAIFSSAPTTAGGSNGASYGLEAGLFGVGAVVGVLGLLVLVRRRRG